MQHVSQANVPHVSGAGGRKVNCPPEALDRTGWVTDDSPVERGNVEENPVGSVLVCEHGRVCDVGGCDMGVCE